MQDNFQDTIKEIKNDLQKLSLNSHNATNNQSTSHFRQNDIQNYDVNYDINYDINYDVSPDMNSDNANNANNANFELLNFSLFSIQH